MEMSACKPVPDNEEENIEEALPENKEILDRMVEGFQLVTTAFDFIYNMELSRIQALKLTPMVGKG